MHQYKERNGEEDKQSHGKTHVKRCGKCGVQRGGLTVQDKREGEYSKSFPATAGEEEDYIETNH